MDVTFNDGQTTESINFTATNDDVDDDSGQVIVRFDTSSLDNVAAGNETTVRITDDDHARRHASHPPSSRSTRASATATTWCSPANPPAATSPWRSRRPPAPTSRSIPRRSRSPHHGHPVQLEGPPQTVTVSAAADDLDAEDDTGTITHIVSGGDYDSVISVGSVSVTVDDDEVSVSFERAAYAAAEGGDAVTVTVRLSAPAKQTFTIDLVKTHQDGATEDDYSALPVSLDVRSGRHRAIVRLQRACGH